SSPCRRSSASGAWPRMRKAVSAASTGLPAFARSSITISKFAAFICRLPCSIRTGRWGESAMQFDTVYLLYGAIFLGSILLIEGGFAVFADLRHGTRRAVNRRLRMLESGQSSQAVLYQLRPDTRVGLFSRTALDRLIAHAGLTISTLRFLSLMAVLTLLVLMLMIALTTIPQSIDVAVAVLTGVVGPLLHLRMLKRKRQKRFAA